MTTKEKSNDEMLWADYIRSHVLQDIERNREITGIDFSRFLGYIVGVYAGHSTTPRRLGYYLDRTFPSDMLIKLASVEREFQEEGINAKFNQTKLAANAATKIPWNSRREIIRLEDIETELAEKRISLEDIKTNLKALNFYIR